MADFGLEWESENEYADSDVFHHDSQDLEYGNSKFSEDQLENPGDDKINMIPSSVTQNPSLPDHSSQNATQNPPIMSQKSFISNDSVRDFIEPMVEDPSKQQEIKSLEKNEINLTPLEAICMRFNSLFVFQRVWSAKEITRLLPQFETQKTMDVLIPIAMKLAEDKHLIVKEAMAQNLLPVLSFYYQNLHNVKIGDSDPTKTNKNEELPSLNQHIDFVLDDAEEDDENILDKGDSAQNFQAPTLEEFNSWIQRLLLSPHAAVSRGAQEAAVAVGKELSFIDFHTFIIHSVVLSLERYNIAQKAPASDERTQEAVIKPRGQSISTIDQCDTPSPIALPEKTHPPSSGNALSQKLANLFGIIDFGSEKTNNNSPNNLNDPLQHNAKNSDASLNYSIPDSKDIPYGSRSPYYSPGAKNSSETRSQGKDASDPQLVHNKLIMLSLIRLLTEEYGQDLKPAVFVPVVERACVDNSLQVRREAAVVIGTLCKALSAELTIEILYPSFLKLVSDSAWQVRKSAASSSLPGLASVLETSEDRTSYTFDRSEIKSSTTNSTGSTLSFSPWGFTTRSWSNNSTKQKYKKSFEEPKLSFSDKDSETPKSRLKHNSSSSNNSNNYISERQWLQIIDRFAGPREPSENVRAAVFECIGQLFISFSTHSKIIDYLINLVQSKVGKASRTWSDDRRSSSGSASFMTDQEVDEDDALDESLELNGFSMSPGYSNRKNYSEFGFGNSRAGMGGLWYLKRAELTPGVVSKDILYYCAYNFPAILQAVGPPMWNKLKDTYLALTKVDQYDIRCTLASSLHEVAKILSQDRTVALEMTRSAQITLKMSNSSQLLNSGSHNGSQSQLSATIDSQHNIQSPSIGKDTFNTPAEAQPISTYSHDLEQVLCLFLLEADDIKVRALKHLGESMQVFSEKSRMRCLPMILQVFRHDSKLWRTREIMASQLVLLCSLFPVKVIVSQLLPIAVEWANDPVAGVRASVAPAFSVVFEQTKNYPDLQVIFFQNVINFSHSTSFKGRIFFTQICTALLFSDSINNEDDSIYFDQFFLPSLASLSNDRVPNVRIALARLVKRMLNNKIRRQSISSVLTESLPFNSPGIFDHFASPKELSSPMNSPPDTPANDSSPSGSDKQEKEGNQEDKSATESGLNSKIGVSKRTTLRSSWLGPTVDLDFIKIMVENRHALARSKSLPHFESCKAPNNILIISYFSDSTSTPISNGKTLVKSKSSDSIDTRQDNLSDFFAPSIGTNSKPRFIPQAGSNRKEDIKYKKKAEARAILELKSATATAETSPESQLPSQDSSLASNQGATNNTDINETENAQLLHNKASLEPGLDRKLHLDKTSPMRAQLLLSILQTLLQDEDADVLEQLAEIPGIAVPEINKGSGKPNKHHTNKTEAVSLSKTSVGVDSIIYTGAESKPHLQDENDSSSARTVSENTDQVQIDVGSSGINLKAWSLNPLKPTEVKGTRNDDLASHPSSSQKPADPVNDNLTNCNNSLLTELLNHVPDSPRNSPDKDHSILSRQEFPSLSQQKLESKSFRANSAKGFHRRSSSGQLYLDQLPSDISDSLKNMNKLAVTSSRPDSDFDPQALAQNLKKIGKSSTKSVEDQDSLYSSIPEIPAPPARALTNATFQLKKS